MSPEILSGQVYSALKGDVFALGVVLFMLLTGREPFEEADPNKGWYKKFVTNKKNYFEKIDKCVKVSQEFKDMITGLLEVDPEKRFSIKDIVNHEWMKGPEEELENIVNTADCVQNWYANDVYITILINFNINIKYFTNRENL